VWRVSLHGLLAVLLLLLLLLLCCCLCHACVQVVVHVALDLDGTLVVRSALRIVVPANGKQGMVDE
jgi:hypothetical protein